MNQKTEIIQGGSILFKNSQRAFRREGTGSVFMKKRGPTKDISEGKSKIRLGFDSSISKHRQLLVGVDPNTTNLFDIGYDAPMFDTNENDMFWNISGNQFVIQGVPDFNSDRIISLGVVIANAGEVTIKIDELENVSSNTKIYLVDNLNGNYHNLKSGNFKTNLPVGDYSNRFSLRFTGKTLTIDETEVKDGITALYSNNYKTLIIRNTVKDATVNTVNLYNLAGQKIANWDVKGREQSIIQIPIKNLPAEIYIVKIKTTQGEFNKKIIIK